MFGFAFGLYLVLSFARVALLQSPEGPRTVSCGLFLPAARLLRSRIRLRRRGSAAPGGLSTPRRVSLVLFDFRQPFWSAAGPFRGVLHFFLKFFPKSFADVAKVPTFASAFREQRGPRPSG